MHTPSCTAYTADGKDRVCQLGYLKQDTKLTVCGESLLFQILVHVSLLIAYSEVWVFVRVIYRAETSRAKVQMLTIDHQCYLCIQRVLCVLLLNEDRLERVFYICEYLGIS
jgi:hypothetical protein